MYDNKSYPFVSVIIPCYNDAHGVSETLTSLSKQNYPPDWWEVLIVDNNSSDNTRPTAESFRDHFRNLYIIDEIHKQSSYAARNRGIEQARGEILAFIDADMTVNSDWLQRGAKQIVAGRGDYIGCCVNIYPRHSSPNLWELYNMRTGFQIKRYIMQYGFAGAGNLFVARKVFQKVGLFDDRLISGGDLEFGNRVKDTGFKLFYDHYNVMQHPARSKLSTFCKKQYRIGIGHADIRHLFPDRYGPLNARFAGRLFSPVIRIRGFIKSDVTLRQKVGILCIANILHFAYGCGCLSGYLKNKLR